MNYDRVWRMGNTSSSISSGELVTAGVSHILSVCSQPFPKYGEDHAQMISSSSDVLDTITHGMGLEGPMSHSVVCDGRPITSSRCLMKQVKDWYQLSD